MIHTRDRCLKGTECRICYPVKRHVKDVYSLKQTAVGNWYVQKNGQDVGDSPKYANKSDAVKSAHRTVTVDPDNREYREIF